MNEKIKQMIDERGMFHQSELYEIAEAVVRECIAVSLMHSKRRDDMGAIIANSIEGYFGVE